MAAAVQEEQLTLAEFHAKYDGAEPEYEYWNGEAIQKPLPKSIHGLIQSVLSFLFRGIGLYSASAVTLRIDPSYEPIPDVISDHRPIEQPYPTKAFYLSVEILSPQEYFPHVMRKCRQYAKWGIRRILVIDPDSRIIWSFEQGYLKETDMIAINGDRTVTARDLWDEVDRQLA